MIFLAILLWTLVPLYLISVIKIAGFTKVLSANRGALTVFVISIVLQLPIFLYDAYVLRKRNEKLTISQVDKIKIFSTIIAAITAFLLNYSQWLPILYFAIYVLTSNRILTYIDVRFNLSKIQYNLASYFIVFLFILGGAVNPLIKSGVIPLLIFIVLLRITTNTLRVVFKFAEKRGNEIIRDVTSRLPRNK